MYEEEMQEKGSVSIFQILLSILGVIFFLLGFAFFGYFLKVFFTIIGPGLWLIAKTIFLGILLLLPPSLVIVFLSRGKNRRRERKAADNNEESGDDERLENRMRI